MKDGSKIVWRWRWSADGAPNDGELYKIVSLYEECDIELAETGGRVRIGSSRSGQHELRCNQCRATFPFIHKSSIRSLILRNVRNGSWRNGIWEVCSIFLPADTTLRFDVGSTGVPSESP